jgi:hypothetical protein
MGPRYNIGQKVRVTPVKEQQLSTREAGLEPYAGQVGEVTDFYFMSSSKGKTFYVYTVRMERDKKDVVLHEDELDLFIP